MKLIELPNGSWIDPLVITAVNVKRKDMHTQRPYVIVIGPDKSVNTIYCKDEECVDTARLIAKQINDSYNKNVTEQNKEYIEKTKEVKNKKPYLALLPPQDAFLYAIKKEYTDLDDVFLTSVLISLDELEDKYEGVYIHSIKNEQIVICVNDKYLTTIYSAGPKYATAIYETANKLVNK